MKRTMLLVLLGVTLAACAGSLFKNKTPPPTMYMLRATPNTAAVDPAGHASRSRNSPFAGMTLPGQVVATFLRGTPTVLDGKLAR